MNTRVDKWKCEVRKVGWIVWKNETMVHRELKRGGKGLMVFKLVGLGAGWIFPSYVSILLFTESSTEARAGTSCVFVLLSRHPLERQDVVVWDVVLGGAWCGPWPCSCLFHSRFLVEWGRWISSVGSSLNLKFLSSRLQQGVLF